ncbi:uncharacterized protein LOC106660986 [Cimex lectularius]|uniref:Uncharacterized protein n=1 Tax=Cimex lectularius TaxID=79782 RepID=A0A8I6R9A0_CIMLE|nr:uncharacterized protein LOC106660986 [Cimex lectularius]XP_014239566.1 uncharacterized protein LOC106660986 [Cimex lectularius]
MPPKKGLQKPKTPSTPGSKGKKKVAKKTTWEIIMEQTLEEFDEDTVKEQYPQVFEAFHLTTQEKTYDGAFKEMKHEWHVYKYCNDLKDMYISKLKDDHMLLEEQKNIMKIVEMEHIDDMLANYIDTVDRAIETYKDRRDRLMRERFTFMNRNFRSAHEDVEYVMQAKDVMMKEHHEEMNHLKGVQTFEKDEQIKKSKAELRVVLKDALKDMLDKFCQIRSIYCTYITNTEKKRRAFSQLKAKDRSDDIIIEKLRDKIASLHIEKEYITKKMKIEYINASKIEDLESEKGTLVDMLGKMRIQLKQDYAEDGARLMHLTNLCNSVIEELQEQERLVEKILKYIILSHKYETLSEKIQPYSTMIERIDIAFNDDFPEYRDLDKFLFRMAQIEIHVDYMKSLLEKYQDQERELKALVSDAVSKFYV